jgi:rifampin ADP-ribosylating transferase
MSDFPKDYYHGSRAAFVRGDRIEPAEHYVYVTPDLDAAIWAAELAEGSGAPRVYRVHVQAKCEESEMARRPYPTMTWRSQAPLTVLEEVIEWTYYHGTRADLLPGELIEPGFVANHGPTPRHSNFVYFTRTLDAAIWGAELAIGEGRERIYLVEATGDYEDDPNLTNARFRGNPTKSFRSRAPLRVLGELKSWSGHAPETVAAMKEGLARLARDGVEPLDD